MKVEKTYIVGRKLLVAGDEVPAELEGAIKDAMKREQEASQPKTVAQDTTETSKKLKK